MKKKSKEIITRTPGDDFSKMSMKQVESLYNSRLKEYNKCKTEENKRRLDTITYELRKRGY
jgi:hypothetical protein